MTTEKPGRGLERAALVTLAVLATVLFMREAQAVVIPALLAFFLAVVADAPVAWLARKGVPRGTAVVAVVVGVALALLAVGTLVGSSAQKLSERAPAYQQALHQRIDSLLAGAESSAIPADAGRIADKISPGAVLGLASDLLSGIGDVFGKAFLILLLVIFILLEVPGLDTKLAALGSSRGAWSSLEESLRSYLAIKTATSLATGVLVGVFLAVLGIEFAVLWGLLAFLLNYVPTLGSFLAALPAVLLALVQNGPGTALGAAAGYLVINAVIANLVEPRIMGEGLGLSMLTVLLSLVFWGWLLGPVGMLLAVPLTTAVKIALDKHHDTRPIAGLLGTGPGAAADETRRRGGRDTEPRTEVTAR